MFVPLKLFIFWKKLRNGLKHVKMLKCKVNQKSNKTITVHTADDREKLNGSFQITGENDGITKLGVFDL